MEIKGILHHYNGCMTLYSPSSISLYELGYEYISKGTLYLYLDTGVDKIINFSKLATWSVYTVFLLSTDTPNGWESLEEHLDTLVIDDFVCTEVPVPSFTRIDGNSKQVTYPEQLMKLVGNNSIDIISAEHTPGITTGYGNYNKRYNNNVYATRKTSKDMIFSSRDAYINLDNTIPVCNGFVCYPKVYNNELYAINGADYSRNTKVLARGWMLIDFSKAGKLDCIPLKSCKGNFDKLILPEDKSMQDKFVLLVIGGKLYLPGEFSRLSNHMLRLDKSYLNSNMDIDRKVCAYNHVFNTGLVQTNNIDYLQDDNSFIITIDNPNMYVAKHECIYKYSDNKFKFSGHVGGLLMDMSTRACIDYTRVQYTGRHFVNGFNDDLQICSPDNVKDMLKHSHTDITIPKQTNINMINDDNLMKKQGLVYTSRTDLDIFAHYTHTPVLIDFMFKNKETINE